MTPTIREVLISVVVAGITAVGSLYIARYELKGELAKSDVTQAGQIFNRMNELEDIVRDMRLEVKELTVENGYLASENNRLKVKVAMLETQTVFGPEARSAAVYELFDSFGRPAWCKRVRNNEDGSIDFVMDHVNPVFEVEYAITYEKFVGGTDNDMFSPALAARYIASDLATYRIKGWSEFAATRPDFNGGGEGPVAQFAKFYHKVQGGPELICGFEIASNEE